MAAGWQAVSAAAILIPVLGRPHRVQPLLDSLFATEQRSEEFRPVFLCSPGDSAEIEAVHAAGFVPEIVDWPAGTKGDYALKMAHGFALAHEEWQFLAADDLEFRYGWFTACLRQWARTKACVIGTNDLHNQRVVNGNHSTHTLVHADYIECGTIDEPGQLLHLGYWHNFVDDEFIGTARWRGTYAHAHDALVEHLHPDWNNADWDDTYRLGKQHFTEDGAYFEARRPMWERETQGTWG